MGHCSCVWFGLEAVRVKEVKRRKSQQSKQKTGPIWAYFSIMNRVRNADFTGVVLHHRKNYGIIKGERGNIMRIWGNVINHTCFLLSSAENFTSSSPEWLCAYLREAGKKDQVDRIWLKVKENKNKWETDALELSWSAYVYCIHWLLWADDSHVI